MSYMQDVKGIRTTNLGLRVDRATATLPATTTGSIFTVAGGIVAITQIIGEVTTIIQNQACNLHITSVPTVGTAVDIGANVNIQALEAGGLIGLTGLGSDAVLAPNAGALSGMLRCLYVPEGVIQIHTSATNTGSIKWSIFYIPIDEGAYITAA
jgi:hypothetical protein